MSSDAEFETAFSAAVALLNAGKKAEAASAFHQLLAKGEHRELVLQALFDLYLHANHLQEAYATLIELIKEVPDSLTYHAHLAELSTAVGQPEIAIGYYKRLLERQPDLAAAHFSVALMYKRAMRFDDAIEAYNKALQLGIDHAEEVYSNLGVLYADLRDVEKARAMYQRALEIDALYEPALFNLAGLSEETGDGEAALDIYRRIVDGNPQHWDSLTRIAQASRLTDANDPLIEQLRNALDRTAEEPEVQEAIYYALGKALDDVGEFDAAYAAYSNANALGKRRGKQYDRGASAQAFDQLIELFDSDWISRHTTDLTDSPIFICGMFRSGSTLVEQMLSGHKAISSGGELDFLPWLIARNLAPYPQRVAEVSAADLTRVGKEYLSMTAELNFDSMQHLTDKRPDNFLHLGLLKAMFPRARFIYTKRNRSDTCLSVFFQQFDSGLAYATDIEDTADYFDQHTRLMQHWHSCFPDDIFSVDYDELVRSPEPVMRKLVDYLGLDWDAQVLAFKQSGGLARTASVAQVREELYQSSSGRSGNYDGLMPTL